MVSFLENNYSPSNLVLKEKRTHGSDVNNQANSMNFKVSKYKNAYLWKN